MTAAKDSVLIRRRLRIFAAAVALVLLCAVCVGGVSGAELHVSATTSYTENDGWYTTLERAINVAASGDRIIIEDSECKVSDQIVLGGKGITPKYITITNSRNVDVKIISGFDDMAEGSGWNSVDEFTLFIINSGTLTLEGNPDGGSITVTTGHNGRGFDVNYDDRPLLEGGLSGGDGNSAELKIKPGVCIMECGFSEESDNTNNGGAVYVRKDGTFTMEGGCLAENYAGAGGAVYVHSSGFFKMTGGLITENKALSEDWAPRNTFGGGLWMGSTDCLIGGTIGGTIDGNTSEKKASQEDYNEIYCSGLNLEILGVVKTSVTEDKVFKTLTAALDATRESQSVTLYLLRDYSQVKVEKWDSEKDEYTNTLEKITITKDVTIQPLNSNVKLLVQGDNNANGGMFIIPSGGELTITGGESYNFVISQSEYGVESLCGGLVYLNGGKFTIGNRVSISGLKAVDGDAVYVADGTFTVKEGAIVDSSNDVYLIEGQVIYAEPDYSGRVGKITLPSYADGTVVVDTGSDASGYPGQFILNQGEGGIPRTLILKPGTPNYLVVKNDLSYIVTIPPWIEISDTGDGVIPISVTTLNIPSNNVVRVYLYGDFILDYQTDSLTDIKLNYQVLKEDENEGEVSLSNGDLVGEFSNNGDFHKTMELIARVSEGRISYSGVYYDTLTFSFGLDSIA